MEENKALIVDAQGNALEHYEPQIIQVSESHLSNLEFLADNMDRFITAKEKIWHAVLRIVKVWTVFGKEGHETADIGWAEADRVAMTFNLSFINWESKKIEKKDEKGESYIWVYECDAIFNGRQVRVQGRFSSRDKLLGIKDGEYRELYDINEQHIQTAAMRNCRKEGVKVLFGISRIPLEELIKAGVKLEYANKVNFEKKDAPKTTDAGNDDRKKVSAMLLEMTKGDIEAAKTQLEVFSGFTGKDGKAVKGKRETKDISDAAIPYVLRKVEAAYKDFKEQDVK